jgi:hypothetical protein
MSFKIITGKEDIKLRFAVKSAGIEYLSGME